MPPEVDPKAPKANPVDAPKVDEVAKQTEDKLTSEGVHAAYTELRGTIGKYRSDLDASDGKKDGNLSADAGKSFKQFQTDLNQAIVDRNLAPDLSIAWAKEAKTRLDFNNSDSIDSAEVRGHVKDTDQFTQLMGKTFAQQLDDGKISSSDPYKPTSLTSSQLDSALQDRTGDRRRQIAESANLTAEQTNAKADESVLQSMVPKRGNAEAVKLIDILDASGGKDGAFNKQDVEQVLKLSSVYGLESKQEAFLKNLNDNWDQKAGLRLREKAENGYPDDKITNDSILTATGEKARMEKANAASDEVHLQAARARAQEGSRADVDFLTKHFVGKDSEQQKSLFDVADLISGDNPNGEVTREEIKKTIDNADVLQLSAEEKSFLTRVHDGWDSDNGVVRLRTEGTGNDAVVKGGITAQSMKTATGELALETAQEQQEKEKATREQREAQATKLHEQKELASTNAIAVLQKTVGATSLLDAADRAGALNNDRSWWWKSGNNPDGKVGSGDLEQLLGNPAFAPLLNKDDRELISAISKGRNDSNSPYYALYDKDGYITEARLNQLKLNPA